MAPWPVFLNFAHNHIFGTGVTRHFRFRVPSLIDTDEYECVHDILLPKGMNNVFSHVTSLNFW